MRKTRTASCLKSILFLAFFSLFLAACTTPKGDPASGKRWYMMNNCFACHGLDGNDGKGPEIRGKGTSFRSFLSTIRNANSPIMPKFPETKITKQEVADMYAWLESL